MKVIKVSINTSYKLIHSGFLEHITRFIPAYNVPYKVSKDYFNKSIKSLNERDLEDEQTFNQKVLESLFPYRIKTLSRMQYIFTYLGPNKKFSVDFRMLTNFFTKAVFNWCELKFDKNLTTAELMHFLVEREFCPIFSKLVKLDLSELNENQFATIARFYPKEIAKHISYLLFCNSDLNIKVFKEVIERFPNLKLVKIIYCNNLSKEAVGNTLNDCELEIYGKYTTEHCYSNW